jgi:hypothetical protein
MPLLGPFCGVAAQNIAKDTVGLLSSRDANKKELQKAQEEKTAIPYP